MKKWQFVTVGRGTSSYKRPALLRECFDVIVSQLSVDGGLGSGRDQRETINIQAAEDKTRTRPDMDLEQVLRKRKQKDLGERKGR